MAVYREHEGPGTAWFLGGGAALLLHTDEGSTFGDDKSSSVNLNVSAVLRGRVPVRRAHGQPLHPVPPPDNKTGPVRTMFHT